MDVDFDVESNAAEPSFDHAASEGLFLQAASTYFHVCSRRFKICEPAPRQPGFRVLKHFQDGPILSCHERGVPEVGIWLVCKSKHPNYGASRPQ